MALLLIPPHLRQSREMLSLFREHIDMSQTTRLVGIPFEANTWPFAVYYIHRSNLLLLRYMQQASLS